MPLTRTFNTEVHLTWQDVATDSKTDPTVISPVKSLKDRSAQGGCTLVVGHTGDKLSTVVAVLGFMAAVGQRQGPLFQYVSGKLLTQ